MAPADIARLLFAETDAVFVKLDRSTRGRDIHRVTRDGFDLAKMAALGDFVVQAPVIAPPELAAAARAAVGAADQAAAGTPLAAVLQMARLPVDIRHASKIDRLEVGRWAGRVLAGGRP